MQRMQTGVVGLDELTDGGLPRGRVTLVSGAAGTGKTILTLQTLVRGARELGEPGLFVSFEEPPAFVLENAAGFDWDLPGLRGRVELVDAELPVAVLHDGAFDLEGLLAVAQDVADEIGARRIVLDGIDVLLDLLDRDRARAEILRLRDWLAGRDLTALVTCKLPDGTAVPERYHFLEFLADCVVLLRHRYDERAAVRELRVRKMRGGAHSSDGFPFDITAQGIEIAGSAGAIRARVSTERVSSGVSGLDDMMRGGYYRGTSVLLSGAPGTAKTTLAGAFADAACARGEHTLYVSFDESDDQIVRNLASVGMDLRPHVEAGTLAILGRRTRGSNAQTHASHVVRALRERGVRHLVVDPISAMQYGGGLRAAEDAALQIIDAAKAAGVTVVCTSLLATTDAELEGTPLALSTLADTWIHLSYVRQAGERNRALTIVKSRGTGHSSQVRELVLGDRGPELAEVYTAGGEVLMGTLRWEKERAQKVEQERARRHSEERQRQAELRLRELELRQQELALLRAAQEAELDHLRGEQAERGAETDASRRGVRRLRETRVAEGER